jgi:predicted nucleic acid-binding Zn ribbon protein
MSRHLCSGCGHRMTQIGQEDEWLFECRSCGARWQIGDDGIIRGTTGGKGRMSECDECGRRGFVLYSMSDPPRICPACGGSGYI